MHEGLVSSETRGNVRIVFLNQPARRNALSDALRAELIDAMAVAQADPALRAIVLTGSGGTFCAGGDIAAMQGVTGLSGRERMRRLQQLARLIVTGDKPVIAAVEGFAYGAGMSLALLCDQVVVAEGARFCASFNRIGLMPDMAALWTLPQRVDAGWCRRLLMLAEEVDAATALRIGLCDELVNAGGALAAALALAEKFAAAAPVALAYTKQMLARGPQDFERLLAMEADLQGLLYTSADLAEGREAFLNKRPARFEGH